MCYGIRASGLYSSVRYDLGIHLLFCTKNFHELMHLMKVSVAALAPRYNLLMVCTFVYTSDPTLACVRVLLLEVAQ